MARYIVGDIQGCALELKQLLAKVNFKPQFDQLWCVGDLVGRGPDSLATIQFLQRLGDAVKIVLGNHDLNLLSVLLNVREADPRDKLDAIIALPDLEKQQLITWLVQQPLMRQIDDQVVISHAGVYPWWTVAQAQTYANEVSQALQQAWQQNTLGEFLQSMYGNEPNIWSNDLCGPERIRFIINAFTRMRFCDQEGHLNFSAKTSPAEQTADADLVPWFELWDIDRATLVFGHWAALMGKTHREDVIGLDTGCVWGNRLTLLHWPSGKRSSVAAKV